MSVTDVLNFEKCDMPLPNEWYWSIVRKNRLNKWLLLAKKMFLDRDNENCIIVTHKVKAMHIDIMKAYKLLLNKIEKGDIDLVKSKKYEEELW